MHRIPRAEEAIRVDGRLDEPAWASPWTSELGDEVDPGENTPAPVRTEALAMHSETHLYVGFMVYDPDPRQIRAHLADRDQARGDDWLGVVLDTFNDARRDHLLVINPLGVQMDHIETRPGGSTVGVGRDLGRRRADRRLGLERRVRDPILVATLPTASWAAGVGIRRHPRLSTNHLPADGRLRARPQNQLLPVPSVEDQGVRGGLAPIQLGGRTYADRQPYRRTKAVPARADGERQGRGGGRRHDVLGVHPQSDAVGRSQSRLLPGGSGCAPA